MHLSKIFPIVALGLLSTAVSAMEKFEDIENRPNILLIVAEDMSPRVGVYGDTVAQTPEIDALASEGIRYTNVFTASGVCAPSRSALITGVYPTSMGTQHMRTGNGGPIEYEAVPPVEVKAFPELLRRAGYATANFAKKDYQFGDPFTIWDSHTGHFVAPLDSAIWRGLPDGKPFFAMINLMWTHESRLFAVGDEPKGRFAGNVEKLVQLRESLIEHVTDPGNVEVPPYYPDTQRVRASIAQMYDNIHYMDSQVGEIMASLEADGLADNTIVIWTTDHGDGFPRAKRAIYDSGLNVPMVIRFPDRYGQNTVEEKLVSFVDLAPTILNLAGADAPEFMQGQDIFSTEEHEYIFAARDRMDEVPDRARAVRDQRYKYIRNYRTQWEYFRPMVFRDMFPIMQELWSKYDVGQLSPLQASYFTKQRPEEELYDTQVDPYEVHNLASDASYIETLERLSNAMDSWLDRVGDLGAMDETNMVAQMWPNMVQPVTQEPNGTVSVNGDKRLITLHSATEGASIGYRILSGDEVLEWQIYTDPVYLEKGQILEAKAIRYGYKESEITRL